MTEYTFRHEMHLSERLMEIAERVLHDANAELGDVTAFAVGIGPGSFTGTRIGVMTLKTWASVLNRPLAGISSLDALAAEYIGLEKEIVVPVLPCRSGIVYACPFDVSHQIPRPLADPAALSLEELAAQIDSLPAADLVSAAQPCRAIVRKSKPLLPVRAVRCRSAGRNFPALSALPVWRKCGLQRAKIGTTP